MALTEGETGRKASASAGKLAEGALGQARARAAVVGPEALAEELEVSGVEPEVAGAAGS